MNGRIQKFSFLYALVFLGTFPFGPSAFASPTNSKPITQTSEFKESAQEAWAAPGFRIGLSYDFKMLSSLGYQPTMLSHGFSIRPHYRFENDWGIGSTISYGIPFQGNSGLNWSVALNGTWWFFEQLGVSVGVGYAGLMVNCDRSAGPCNETLPNRDGQEPQREDLWLEEGQELRACTGGGLILNTRLDYNLPVKGYFATGPYIQSYYETIQCKRETGSSHPDTGRLLHYLDTWSYFGIGAGWWFTWQ